MPVLCGRGSLSGTIFAGLTLTRSVIREVMERLQHSRVLQATISSIVCATRFKYFEGSVLLPVECQYCGQIDNFQHVISCTNMGPPPTNRDLLVDYLAELASRARNVNPNRPIPFRRGESMELALDPVMITGQMDGE